MAKLGKVFQRAAKTPASSGHVEKIAELRREFEALWSRRNLSVEHAVQSLQSWCSQAEATGVSAMVEFSKRIRMYSMRRATA